MLYCMRAIGIPGPWNRTFTVDIIMLTVHGQIRCIYNARGVVTIAPPTGCWLDCYLYVLTLLGAFWSVRCPEIRQFVSRELLHYNMGKSIHTWTCVCYSVWVRYLERLLRQNWLQNEVHVGVPGCKQIGVAHYCCDNSLKSTWIHKYCGRCPSSVTTSSVIFWVHSALVFGEFSTGLE